MAAARAAAAGAAVAAAGAAAAAGAVAAGGAMQGCSSYIQHLDSCSYSLLTRLPHWQRAWD